MKIAYFDCFAGAAGDMIVAAMLDAGLDAEFLKAQLATLGLKNFDIKITETKRTGLRALSFLPVVQKEHAHRNLKDITKIITQSKISEQAKKTAITVFEKIAKAEGKVHGKDPNEIHFHEVGALDSIVDIVSASIGFAALGLDKIYCSTLSVGGGTIECAHELLPVPAPATAELLKGVPIISGPGQFELLTPTAAAILTTVVDRFCPLPAMSIEAIGYGAGSRQSQEFPNVLRLILGQTVEDTEANADSVCLLETNIDDASGELLGSTTEKLFKQGALDVFTTPIYMKHGRPAGQISVICKIEDAQKLEQLLFGEGLTFGIRRQILQRSKLARQLVTVQTEFGEIRIKTGSLAGKIVNAKPEFSDCSAAAEKHKVTVKAVLDAAMAAYKKRE
ncbi:MAG: nickel pincer cofactor biosynthesis protein LarC [Phycisphaerae bacterium]|nr:nickel pincer cofactor biosynthesis protein LarC [Phycisphaerae bacterium]MDD5381368.1 nickel pincer cofactor biosynthesis protein LarC [Phycisphaerae bacterium]